MKGLEELKNSFLMSDEISDQEVVDAILSVPEHRSAGLVVDLGNTALFAVSWPSTGVAADDAILITSGGAMSSLSGVLIGAVVDLLQADTYCNLWAAGKGFGSGPLLLQVQTADAVTSGSFTDPTSGLAAGDRPGAFLSGTILVIGSGPATDATLGILGSGYSGSFLLSGWAVGQGFVRVGRYARVNVLSGFYDGTLVAGFLSQLKTTGSGGGFSFSPGSGSVSV